MKKSSIQGIALTFLLTTFFFSCGKGKQKQIDNLKFDKITLNITTSLLEEEEGSPACNLIIDHTYPVMPSDHLLTDSINKHLITVCFGEKYQMLPTETAIDSFKNDYIRSYKNDLAELYLKETEESSKDPVTSSAWYSYYHEVKAEPITANPLYLSYQIVMNEYTGGAHGNYATSFLNFNPETGRLLTLKDVFKSDYEETLNEKLLSQLMKKTKTSSFEDLQEMGYFLWTNIYPSDNFLLKKEGIEFFYNVYEIAPYAMGTTTLLLPYRELKEELKIPY